MEKTKTFKSNIGELTGYLTGSALLDLNNRKDIDYIVPVPDNTDISAVSIERAEGEDLFIKGESEFKKYRGALSPRTTYPVKTGAILTCLSGLADDDCPYKLDFDAEERAKIVKFLKRLVHTYALNKTCAISSDGKPACSKNLTNIMALLQICENGVAEDNRAYITGEQRTELQEIHDIRKPLSFTDEIIARIEKLD